MDRQISLINNEEFDSLDKAKKSKIYFLCLQDLKSNPLNQIYEERDTKEDLEELILSIRENGLQQPLTVSKSDTGYVLLSGHRRMKALSRLFAEKEEVKYNGIVLGEDNIPVIIQYVYKTQEEQFRALVASNCYRHLSKETNMKLIAEAVKIYNRTLSKGDLDPGRTRDNIARLANVSGRSVQRYVDFGKKGEPVKMKDSVKNETVQQTERKKLMKRMASMENYFTSMDTSNYNQDDLQKMKAEAIPLINIIMQRLDIDVGEL